jgi:hypothetical protein
MWIDVPIGTGRVIVLVCALGQVVCGLIALPLLFRMIWLLRPRSDRVGRLNTKKKESSE